MTTSPSYVDDWQQPPLVGRPRVGNRTLALAIPIEKRPSLAANVLTMASGRNLVQRRLAEDGEPEAAASTWQWTWPLQAGAVDEEDFHYLRELWKRAAPFLFVDHDVELEAFTAGPALTAFTMARPTAISAWAGYAPAFATRAFVNGVELDVVESGSPAAGEVLVSGVDVEVGTALVAGDELTVRYVAAYYVVVAELPVSLPRYDDLTAAVSLIEARGQA